MTRKICLLVDCPDSLSNDDLIDKLHKAILKGHPTFIKGEDPEEIEVRAAYPIDSPLTRIELSFATQFLTKEQAKIMDGLLNG